MTNEKPELNELTPVAGAIRILKELKENIASKELSKEEIFEKIDSVIITLNALGARDHLNSYSKKP
ncbi:hypothetical protein [Sphingobacterium siyangense]|uniref:hypothetical protein n=1 Tax=Sphingobacterium siyangense TaxID=459529 RepID=UPI003DA2E8BE